MKRLYILEKWHGKGVAHQLMDHFMEYAERNDYSVVFLGVWEHNNRARRFYEKRGFVYSGHGHDFPIGNTPQTDLWYWRLVKGGTLY